MQAAEPRKFGFDQSRNSPKDAQLLAMFELGLKTHHVEKRAETVVLAQLHDGVRLDLWMMRVCQPERFHRPVPQCFAPALGHHLNWQATVEIRRCRFEV